MIGVYLVTDERLCGSRGVVATVRAAVDAGVRAVQLRDKSADLTAHLRLLEQLAEVIDHRALLLVNDRVDAVVAARLRGLPVDGVHLGQGDGDPRVARKELGPTATIGLSTQNTGHLDEVAGWPPGTVDYLGMGAIHATATKPDHPAPLGIDGFARLAAGTTLPTVAIGGITTRDIAALRQAGACGVAVVSAICGAPDPAVAAHELVQAWDSAAPPS